LKVEEMGEWSFVVYKKQERMTSGDNLIYSIK